MSDVHFPVRNYAQGEVLFRRGDLASTFYVIQSGQVDLFVPPSDTFLLRLGPGDSFGEQSILSGGVRSATAIAASELQCTEITAKNLDDSVLSQETLIRPVLEALLMQLALDNALHSVLPQLFHGDAAPQAADASAPAVQAL
jgi:CRP-like cAMP-binding protein